MDEIKNVTVTYVNGSGNQEIARGRLSLEGSGKRSMLALRYQDSFSESLTKKAGAVKDVVVEHPGDTIVSLLYVSAVATGKAVLEKITGNHSPPKISQIGATKRLEEYYDKKIAAYGPDRLLWYAPFYTIGKISYPGNEIVLFNLEMGGSFTLTFSKASVAKNFFDEMEQYFKSNDFSLG